jgi:hypothetical protein
LATLLVVICAALVFPSHVLATAGQWSASGSYIYYNDGNVGLGTSTPTKKLEIVGSNTEANFEGLSLGTVAGRNWLFVNEEFSPAPPDDANGRYSLIIQQPDYPGCGACTGSLVLRPGKMVHIPWVPVGIGTSDVAGYKLAVDGKIKAKEIVVSTGWSDFVFDDDYDLMPLKGVEDYIEENGHLPHIPAGKEVEEKGLSMGEMQKLHMQKIEELTLYLVEQNKQIEKLQQENKELFAKLSK